MAARLRPDLAGGAARRLRPRGWLLPLALLFGAVKAVQAFLYPDPYLIGDTEEFLLSAISREPNPYKPMGYSLFLALVRPVAVTPLGLVVLQGVLRFGAVAWLLRVMEIRYGCGRRSLFLLGAALALDPTALYVDHFLLSDSLFVTLTLASLAALLAHLARPRARALAVLALVLACAIPVRFVGFVYPLLAVTVIALGAPLSPLGRLLHCATVALTTAGVVIAMSAHVHARYGIYAPTTFTGFAFTGTIGPLLDFSRWRLPEGAHPELGLVYDYFASFPRAVYEERNTNWHRWFPTSPSKQLLGVFMGKPPDDEAAWERGWAFLTGFTALAETPSTPAQRAWVHGKRVSPSPHRIDHRSAFVVTNALLERFTRAFLEANLFRYVTGFYAESARKIFLPLEKPIAHGTYTFRQYPDGSVTRFWPGQETTEWKPRRADVGAHFRWLYAWVVPLEWLVALALTARALRRLRPGAVLRSPGVWLVGFALANALAVAWGHMMEIRYLAPILPFALAGATLSAGSRTT